MDSKTIDELLEKYWNCQTTVEEEQQLQNYFRTAQIPESLKETAALFLYFEQQRTGSLPDRSFEDNVLRKIKKPTGRTVSFVYNSMRIAAGIVVLILAVWLVRLEVRKNPSAEMADTYSDPDKAFQETKRALLMISKSFSTAEEQVKKINLFNEAQEEIRTRKEEAEL